MSAHSSIMKAARKPLFLSARIVDRLTEASNLAGLEGGIEAFAGMVLGNIVQDFERGDFSLILGAYEFGSEEAAADVKEALADLALRWQNEDKLHAEKEVCHG